ncbi:HNH endonuclease signature motif containing protein [Pseudonocardia broussonetiae]|uniref:DUF222 domain-containing protein n=1 Tax=Pseudonocardia broussonetiae TaxID=2736640 RepID=A0A6M6JRF7_9PSEU|nr:HNH endonuclease signature motif containing protein [Pseudonocardia broussonetiae]QJY49232.1 DUF222 domain-containing protein [Pseudonocardia broussonetiae]
MLTLCENLARRVEALSTAAIATPDDQGAFLTRGYRSTARALADLLSVDHLDARRRTAVAGDVHARTTLDGTPLPARLPATAAAFADGDIALRHVEVIGRVLATDAASRLTPEQWASVEAQLAADATRLTPTELQTLGTALVALLDQGGAEPDDHTPAPVNELRLRCAVTARDRGCAHPGCDRPPSWSEVHHIHHWEHGGPTALNNLVMLCKAHHRQIHHTDWQVRTRDGLPEFVPPRWIDPAQRPRRTALAHLAA